MRGRSFSRSTISLELLKMRLFSTPSLLNLSNINTNQIRQKLIIFGFIHKDMLGDGNCFYNYVALYIDHSHLFLRNNVANSIENNLGEFQDFSERSANQTIYDYIQNIKNGNEWATNTEIVVLIRSLSRPIVVIGPAETVRNSVAVEEFLNGEPIFVYLNGHKH